MPVHTAPSWLRSLTHPDLRSLLLLGFSSGLPLALCGSTLQAWLTTEGVSLQALGWLTLVGLPYTWKFVWAPFMDRFVVPFLGRRRGWIFLTQATLTGLILTLGQTPVASQPLHTALLAFLLAFVSASQDIVIDAYRADLLRPQARGPGAAASVLGYRLAMLASGALALIVAGYWGWARTYTLMATLMGLGLVTTVRAPEPEQRESGPHSLRQAVLEPLREFLQRPQALTWLGVILLFKLGDAFAGALSSTFLIRGVGFSITEVGMVNKGVGLFATLLGATLGGALMTRWGLYASLWRFGLLQNAVTLCFCALALKGHDLGWMVGAVFLENLGSGMGTTAFTALLMSLCHARFSATQFALLSALAAMGRVYVGPLSGFLAAQWGWPLFYLFATLVGVPALLLLGRLRPALLRLDAIDGEATPQIGK